MFKEEEIKMELPLENIINHALDKGNIQVIRQGLIDRTIDHKELLDILKRMPDFTKLLDIMNNNFLIDSTPEERKARFLATILSYIDSELLETDTTFELYIQKKNAVRQKGLELLKKTLTK